MNLKGFLEYLNKLTSKKNAYNVIVVLLVGVLLIIVTNFFKGTESTVSPQAVEANAQLRSSNELDLKQYESETQAELKSMLAQIKGIGKVDVMINFQNGGELVLAMNSNIGTSVTDETDPQGGHRKVTQDSNGETVVMQSNGSDNTPVILKKKTPQVEGVVVLAEGAQDKEVRDNITGAVSSLFGIPNYKIKVLQMN